MYHTSDLTGVVRMLLEELKTVTFPNAKIHDLATFMDRSMMADLGADLWPRAYGEHFDYVAANTDGDENLFCVPRECYVVGVSIIPDNSTSYASSVPGPVQARYFSVYNLTQQKTVAFRIMDGDALNNSEDLGVLREDVEYGIGTSDQGVDIQASGGDVLKFNSLRAGPNLLLNQGFEVNTSNWTITNGTLTRDTATALALKDGVAAGKLVATALGDMVATSNTTTLSGATTGRFFIGESYVYVDPASPLVGKLMKITVEATGGGSPTEKLEREYTIGAGMNTINRSLVLAANDRTGIKMYVTFEAAPAGAVAWFDCSKLREAHPASGWSSAPSDAGCLVLFALQPTAPVMT